MLRPGKFFFAIQGLISFSFGSFCFAVAATSPATQPTIQSLKQEEYLRQLQEKSALAFAKTTTLPELIHIHLRDGRLVADSPIKGDSWVRVGLDNSLLLCTVRQPAEDFLQFTLDDFTDPRNVYMQTEILAAPGQLEIVGSWELDHAERFVTLIEKYPDVDEQGRKAAGQTRLIVQEMSDSGVDNVNFTLTASSWAALLREHPQEVRKYFRPVLMELQNGALLRPDPNIQWQIFGPRAIPEPAATAAVQKLLPLLDSESFSQRQNAFHQLIALSTPGAIALMHVDEHSLSPEQSARIADVLLPYRQLSTEQAGDLAGQQEFLLDCMDSEDAQLRRLASEQLGSVLKHPVAFDPSAPATARESQLANLRQNLLPNH
jgi:hypothetical protein